jgi:hypothetical protein
VHAFNKPGPHWIGDRAENNIFALEPVFAGNSRGCAYAEDKLIIRTLYFLNRLASSLFQQLIFIEALKNPEFEIRKAGIQAFYKPLAHVIQGGVLHGLADGYIPGMHIHTGNTDTKENCEKQDLVLKHNRF